ncbi:hypothetical protein [Actinoplanes sp. NPDC051494]|uniref:hypothetical protein n=1 Tax=Actinoplanes sp. NPDC051494 TaxID=3363907 RepID=UPI0037BE1E33
MPMIRSWWGRPVPRRVKAVSAGQLSSLIAYAQPRFSRQARSVELEDRLTYFLIPTAVHTTPEQAWICRVVAVDLEADRPHLSYDRLEVETGRFARLPKASRTQQDQLLHWLAHTAGR